MPKRSPVRMSDCRNVQSLQQIKVYCYQSGRLSTSTYVLIRFLGHGNVFFFKFINVSNALCQKNLIFQAVIVEITISVFRLFGLTLIFEVLKADSKGEKIFNRGNEEL